MKEKDQRRYIEYLEEIIQQRGITIRALRDGSGTDLMSKCIAHSMSATVSFIQRDTARLARELRSAGKSLATNPRCGPSGGKYARLELILFLLQKLEDHSRLTGEMLDNIKYDRWTLPGVGNEANLNSITTSLLEQVWNHPSFNPRVRVALRLNQYIPDLPLRGSELFQIVFQLVKNSFEALYLSSRGRINISTDMENEHVLLKVSDNGTGIAPEIQGRIFNLHFTTKKEARDGNKHPGLGLYSISRIINEVGGSIDCDSAPGRGTTFTVCLPIQRRTNRSSGSPRNIVESPPDYFNSRNVPDETV